MIPKNRENIDRMKRALKLIAGNIAVLIVLLVVIEIILRVAGAPTIFQMERGSRARGGKYERFCRRVLEEKLVVYNSFYTDGDGIFKANPGFDFNNSDIFEGEFRINSDGFRGNEFKYIETPTPRVLLLGDSFTWGAKALPINNCFADLLQEAGYYIYNSGIPAVDPLQYARIAEKYIPLLKPDVAAVCLYLGNDIKAYPHPSEPNRTIRYTTNMGMLIGYDDNGRFFNNANEAFQYLKKRKCGHCSNLWDYFIYKTVLGKAVHNILNLRKSDYRKRYKPKLWVTGALKRIQIVCNETGTRFLLFIIPVAKRNERKWNSLEGNKHVLKDFEYFLPDNLESADYCKAPNDHFNNRGHRKFADFMIKVLTEKGYAARAD